MLIACWWAKTEPKFYHWATLSDNLSCWIHVILISILKIAFDLCLGSPICHQQECIFVLSCTLSKFFVLDLDHSDFIASNSMWSPSWLTNMPSMQMHICAELPPQKALLIGSVPFWSHCVKKPAISVLAHQYAICPLQTGLPPDSKSKHRNSTSSLTHPCWLKHHQDKKSSCVVNMKIKFNSRPEL